MFTTTTGQPGRARPIAARGRGAPEALADGPAERESRRRIGIMSTPKYDSPAEQERMLARLLEWVES